MPIRYLDEQPSEQPKGKIRFLDDEPQKQDFPFLQRASYGVIDPIMGAGQLVGKGLEKIASVGGLLPNPVSESFKKGSADITQGVSDLENRYEYNRKLAGQEGIDWGRIAGNVASPINWFVPTGGVGTASGGGKAVALAGEQIKNIAPTLGQNIAKGSMYGAALGTTAPVSGDKDFWETKLQQAGVGAIGGAVAPIAGRAVEKVLNPAKNEAAMALEKSGIPLTLGQKMGGFVDDIEQKLTSVPFMGKAISNRRDESLREWNKTVLDDIAAPLGKKVTNYGQEGIKQLQGFADDAYDAARAKMKPFVFDQEAGNAVIQSRSLVDELSPEYQNIYKRIITRLQTAVDGNEIKPSEYKTITSEIGRELNNFATSQSPFDRKFADALSLLDDAVSGAAKRQNPEAGAMMDAADSVYANLVRVENATKTAATNKANTGIFTPNQLMSAVRSSDTSIRKRATAGGDALMQDVAQRGMSVLGNTVPDSGTAGRAAMMVGLLGGGGTAAFYNPAYAVGAATGLAAGTGLYTKAGQKMAKALLTQRPELMRTIGTQASKYSPYLGAPLAVPLANNVGN